MEEIVYSFFNSINFCVILFSLLLFNTFLLPYSQDGLSDLSKSASWDVCKLYILPTCTNKKKKRKSWIKVTTVSFASIQRQTKRNKIINFDDVKTIVLNFHNPKKDFHIPLSLTQYTYFISLASVTPKNIYYSNWHALLHIALCLSLCLDFCQFIKQLCHLIHSNLIIQKDRSRY